MILPYQIIYFLIKFSYWIYAIKWNFFKISFYSIFFNFFFICLILLFFLSVSTQALLLLFFKIFFKLLNSNSKLIIKVSNNFLFPIIYLNLWTKHFLPVFPIFNYTKFRLTYEKKEKQPFLIVENYGNVSSIKYDLSEYPLREFKIFKVKLKPLLDKLDTISLEPVVLVLNDFFKILYFDINPFFKEKWSSKKLLVTKIFWLYVFTFITNTYLLNILLNFNKYIKYADIFNFYWIFIESYGVVLALERFFIKIINFFFIFFSLLIWFIISIFYQFWYFFILYLEKNNLLLTDKKIRRIFLFLLKIKRILIFFYNKSIAFLLLIKRIFLFYCLFVLEQLFPTYIYFIKKGDFKKFFKISLPFSFSFSKIFKNYIKFGWKFF